tara:strand:+ start:1700 stop:2092 length:393 start_codon:yes stop_codon:yes gene_type:complete
MTTKLKDILNEINLHEEDPTADPSTGLSRRVMARLGPAKQKLKIAFGELDDKIIAKLSQLPRGEQEGIIIALMKLFGIKLADFNALKPKVSAALKADEQGGDEAGGEETEGGSDSSSAMSTDDMKKSLGL